ncbi:hypothetical protein [Streptomyces sp. NPDC091040]|uniref:hypothetical protein n=1 Tax=Streptomyces sp. NPDC091040 TaxID=3365972 RepID=UPI0037FEA5FB
MPSLPLLTCLAKALEDVRWLPRRGASFWLLDGRLVQFHHFTGAGDWVPHEKYTVQAP